MAQFPNDSIEPQDDVNVLADSEPSDEDILKEARLRLDLAEKAEMEIRKHALEDHEFRKGDQWPGDIRKDRDRDGRPCLVINRLPQFIQQVTNDQRQNRSAIKVHPLDSQADQDTADVIQGLIRHIEYNSNAEVAYDTAFESAATGGFGYFRIVTDYVSPDSFDQEIFIKRIRDPFSVFFDPYSQEPDGSDAAWAFIVDEMKSDEFKAKYPDSELTEALNSQTIGNSVPGWVGDSGIRIAEYFYKTFKDEQIHLLSTGETVRDAELHDRLTAAASAGIQTQVVRSRSTRVPVIKWCKINGVEVLEKTDWPGAYIPIIPVYGAELYVNGQRVLESVIRHAKDPQRMLNYWRSAETEAIALAPRAPWIAAEGQLEGYESEWKTANRRNHAYLYYKPTTLNGQPAPPPQRQAFEPAVQAITQAAMMAGEELKSTTGIYDAGTGAQGNETSGVAIQRRGNQIQTSTFHFVDNLKRSQRHCGRILVDLLPKIYDTARAARIIGDDGTQKLVRINQNHVDPETGEERIYDVTVGRYDVVIDTGPSFASKRQEAAESMQNAIQAFPPLMQAAGDIMIRNMDWPGKDEIADRLQKMLPPQLQDDPKNQQVPPQVQALIQQQHAYVQQLEAKYNDAVKLIETKKMELDHRERVEMIKTQADVEINLAKLQSQSGIELLKQEVGSISQRLKFLGMNQPIDAPQDFNPEQADGGNYAGFGHVGGSPTGGQSPGTPMEGNP